MKTKKLAMTAIIAAIYFTLCLILPFGYGTIQFRVAEIMTLMPLFFGWTGVLGVTIGCACANLLSPFWLIDVVFGSLITFVAAILTLLMKKKPFLAALPPVLLNALLLPVIWYFAAGDGAYVVNMLSNFASQFVIIYLVGVPMVFSLKKSGIQLMINNFLTPKNLKNAPPVPCVFENIEGDNVSLNPYVSEKAEDDFDIQIIDDKRQDDD